MNQHFRELRAGEVVFRQGQAGDCAYLVESGSVEIVVENGGSSRRIARLGPQELFGEMALLGDARRSASAVACEATRLRIVSAEYLLERFAAADPLLRHLLRVLSDRCRHLLGGDDPLPPGSAFGRAARAAERDDRERAISRMRMQQALERALEGDEFALHYQPIVRLDGGATAGYEALLRWSDPERGAVSPAVFIPAAEETGLILRIGHWIIDRACAALAGFGRAGRTPFVSLNLSARQMDDPRLLETLDAAVRRHGVSPGRVKLELTESAVLREFDRAVGLLESCRARGFRIAIDDFGAGYSSLSYLHRLPADSLKLDRSFLTQLHDSASGRAIVGAVVRLAHELGMDVIAEGVELAGQAQMLGALGVDYVQGYLYGKAQPLDQVLCPPGDKRGHCDAGPCPTV